MVTLTTQDHVMCCLTAIMLFIAMKIAFWSPIWCGIMIWFNMSMFDRYARRRRDENT